MEGASPSPHAQVPRELDLVQCVHGEWREVAKEKGPRKKREAPCVECATENLLLSIYIALEDQTPGEPRPRLHSHLHIRPRYARTFELQKQGAFVDGEVVASADALLLCTASATYSAPHRYSMATAVKGPVAPATLAGWSSLSACPPCISQSARYGLSTAEA